MAEETPEQQPKAIDKLFQKTKKTIASAGNLVGKATGQSGQIASSATAAAGQAIGKASDTAKAAADSVGEGFDVVSGKRILDLVEQRLELQARYNDVLATKLEEALQRIAVLEREILS